MRRVIVFSLLLVALATRPAAADETAIDSGGSIDGDGGTVRIDITSRDPGSPGGAGESGGSGTSSTGTDWRVDPGYYVTVTWTPSAVFGIACPYGVEVTTRHYADGSTDRTTACAPPPSPPAVGGGGGVAPPAAPVLPTVTIDDALAHVDLPHPTPGVSPPNAGLVGLDTWLWWPAPTGVETTTTLGGITAGIRFEATQWRWDTGDGATYTASRPGSRQDPAVTHVYRRHGEVTIVVTTSWTAEWWTTDATGNTITTPLGTHTTTDQLDYPVRQAQPTRLH